MKTLYININGEDVKSNQDLMVVGGTDDAIVNKFYYELGKEIIKGVIAPGIDSVKKREILTGFMTHEAFKYILEQWKLLKSDLLGENPSGLRSIMLPEEYIIWLQDSSRPVYSEIAKSLYKRGRIVEVSLDKIYKNAIGVLVNNIDPNECKQFVVNDNNVTDDSAIVSSISTIMRKSVFVPFEDWRKTNYESNEEVNNLFDQSHPSAGIRIINIPKDYEIGIKTEECHTRTVLERKGLPLLGDGLILVEELSTHKFGYINELGKVVIPCSYSNAMPFSGGFAWVQKDSSSDWLIIDAKGNVSNVVSTSYDIYSCNGSQVELYDNLFYTQDGRYLMSGNGLSRCETITFSDEGIKYTRNGHKTLYNNDNRIIMTKDFVVEERDNHFGLINVISKKEYIPCLYSKILYLGKYCYYLEKEDGQKKLAFLDI